MSIGKGKRMDSLEHRAREELRQSQLALVEAQKDFREARQHVERLRIKVETLTSLLGASSDDKRQANELAASQFVERRGASDADHADLMRWQGKSTVQIIENVLKYRGTAMRVSEIVNTALGWGYGGENADRERIFAKFSSALSRGAEDELGIFRKLDRGTFDLAARAPA